MLEGCDVGQMVGTAVLLAVLVGIGVRVAVGGTAVFVLVGVGVAVLLGIGVLVSLVGYEVFVGVPARGNGMILSGVSETAVPVPRN